MTVESQPSSVESLAQAVRAGRVAARLSVVGEPNSDRVESAIVLGVIDDDQISYNEEAFPGVPIVHYSEARRTTVIAEYTHINHGRARGHEVKVQLTESTQSYYDNTMLLKNPLLNGADLKQAPVDLIDNASFRGTNYYWQVSTIGLMTGIRPLCQVLYTAGGGENPVTHERNPALTDSERRANLISYTVGLALDRFMFT